MGRGGFDSLGKLLLCCSLVPLLIGLFSLFQAFRTVVGAERIEATVSALQSRKPWPGKPVHVYPILSFVDSSGTSRRIEMQSYSFPVTLEPGSKLEILFNPHHPTEVMLDSWRGRWAQPLLGIGFGVLLVLAALFVGRASPKLTER